MPVDPAKSGGTDRVLRLDLPDDTSAWLHVRRAGAKFVEDPDACPRDPSIVLMLSGEVWAKVYLSAAPVDALIEGGRSVMVGDAAEAARALGVFDRYDQARVVVVPPTSLMQDHMKIGRDRSWIATENLMRDKK